MKRNLLNQMRKEWSDNIWMIVGFTIILAVVWAISTLLYVEVKGLLYPTGYNVEDVYSLSFFWLDEGSAEYVPVENRWHSNAEDLRSLVKGLRENPNVEAVAIHENGDPYNGGYNGWSMMVADGTDTVRYIGNVRKVTPDIIKVLKIKSVDNTTTQQLIDMLKRGEILVSPNPTYEEEGGSVSYLKGKRTMFSDDSTKIYRVGGVIETIRRNDYDIELNGTILLPMDEKEDILGNVLVRVKPGRGPQFLADLDDNPDLLSRRNVFLNCVMSMDEVRSINQYPIDIKVRGFIAMISLLLTIVFCGLLGSFWIRVQQRKGEIAIRKVCGASRRMIFMRIITEGWILLLFAAFLVSICVWPYIERFESKLNEEWHIFLVTELISIILLGMCIVIGLWYPARKAMNIEPAIAIKDE